MSNNIFSLEPQDVKMLVARNEVLVCVVEIGRVRLSTLLMFTRSSLMAVGMGIMMGWHRLYKVRFSTQSIFKNHDDLNYTVPESFCCQIPRSKYCEMNWPR